MPASPHLHLEGQLVATAEVVDPYHHDRDEWHKLFLFRADDGYTLVSFARSETYSDAGCLPAGILDVHVDHAGDVRQLEELVAHRWPLHSDAWWQLLDAGRHDDDELHARWVPERMRRDLDQASLFDRRLALTTGYFNGQPLPAAGRSEPGWRDAALEAMAEHLEQLGWRVEPGPPGIAHSAEPGGILSEATEIVGGLRVRRYGSEAAVLVRVDDCDEIHTRLTGPDEVGNARLRRVEEPEFTATPDAELAERLAELAIAQLHGPSLGVER